MAKTLIIQNSWNNLFDYSSISLNNWIKPVRIIAHKYICLKKK